ncbi:hypothetical protein BDQ17DRAFT_1344830 [Cyathus striatus]|nr:hypothetical protein BDQ17DRAFT_1344830 [Cyathus striatus]
MSRITSQGYREYTQLNSRPPAHTVVTTIHSLPAELLHIIFCIIHQDVLHRNLIPPDSVDAPGHPCILETNWCRQEDLAAASLFPFALASVCRQWRNVASCAPIFWTRVVVFVDSNPTDRADVRAYLEWSDSLPIEVLVLKRDGHSGHDPHERRRVAAVMKTILSHLSRIERLYVYVNQSSSLPSIQRYFHGEAPILKCLTLKCNVDDGPSRVYSTRCASESRVAFHCPLLTGIKLDGQNFRTICLKDPTWFSRLPVLRFLDVSHLRPSGTPEEQLTIETALRVISAIPHLRNLSLTDVNFCPGPRHEHDLDDPLIFGELFFLTIDSLNVAALRRLFDLTDVEPGMLRLRRCAIDVIGHIPHSTYLTLEEIDDRQDILDFLDFWDGEVVTFTACPAFNDRLLESLAGPGNSTSSSRLIAPSLRAINIEGCPNFSASALRRMVETRNEIASLPGNIANGLAAINKVSVSGVGPRLSEEDITWMRSNLRTFYWYTHCGDGAIYHAAEKVS